MPSHAEHGCRCLPRQAAWLQARTMLSHRRGAMPSHARRGCRCLPRQAAWLQARVLSHRREAMRCRRMPKNVLRPSFLHLGGPFLHPGIGRCASDHLTMHSGATPRARERVGGVGRWCSEALYTSYVTIPGLRYRGSGRRRPSGTTGRSRRSYSGLAEQGGERVTAVKFSTQ